MELEGLGFQVLGWALAQLPFSGPPGIHELLFLFVARRYGLIWDPPLQKEFCPLQLPASLTEPHSCLRPFYSWFLFIVGFHSHLSRCVDNKIIHFLPPVLVSWLVVHLDQAVLAEGVKQTLALELLLGERDECEVPERH